MSTIVSIRKLFGALTIAGVIGLTSLTAGTASADEPWFPPANTKYTAVMLQRTASPASNQLTTASQGTTLAGGPISHEPIVICDKMGCHEFP